MHPKRFYPLAGLAFALALSAICGLAPAQAANAPVYRNTAGQPAGATGVVVLDSSGNIISGAAVVVTATDKGGAITTGGTAQTAIAANTSRKAWCIQNPPTASENLQVRVGTAATSTTGMTLAAGQQTCNPPGLVETGIISVFGATTAHAWQGTELQ